MSRLVETAIASAGTALLTGDLSLAESVIADDHTIDAMERDLDERCVLLIAQQQPVARDLRVIVAGLRMSASLERMGDLARHIAEIARLRYPAKTVPPELEGTFSAMHQAATTVAREDHDGDGRPGRRPRRRGRARGRRARPAARRHASR